MRVGLTTVRSVVSLVCRQRAETLVCYSSKYAVCLVPLERRQQKCCSVMLDAWLRSVLEGVQLTFLSLRVLVAECDVKLLLECGDLTCDLVDAPDCGKPGCAQRAQCPMVLHVRAVRPCS